MAGAASCARGRRPAAAGAAAAASRGSLGRSAAAAAARTPTARGERSYCSSPGEVSALSVRSSPPPPPPLPPVWESGEERLEEPPPQRLGGRGRPQRPRPAAHGGAEAGGRAGTLWAGAGLAADSNPRRQLARHAFLGLKKDKPERESFLLPLPLRLSFELLHRLLSPPPPPVVSFLWG
ncbi:atherin-like [Papio anubis]|uniref:atherin-like n=1 Tax=Papio anubis TaxID=9555 RepID=UPI0012AE1058|nr:atherin-like [Papio anubis]